MLIQGLFKKWTCTVTFTSKRTATMKQNGSLDSFLWHTYTHESTDEKLPAKIVLAN